MHARVIARRSSAVSLDSNGHLPMGPESKLRGLSFSHSIRPRGTQSQLVLMGTEEIFPLTMPLFDVVSKGAVKLTGAQQRVVVRAGIRFRPLSSYLHFEMCDVQDSTPFARL
jgi:hypothetical protein